MMATRDKAWLVTILLLAGLWGAYHFYPLSPVPLNTSLVLFPTVLGHWSGEDVDPQVEPFRLYRAHEELARIYRDDAGHAIRLYVGYYESQEQGRELINYSSRNLYLGSLEVTLSPNPSSIYRVNRIPIDDGGRTSIALFWFDLNGRIVTNPYHAKLVTALDALIRGRTNGAIVAVSIPAEQPDDSTFIRELIPALQKHLPTY